jgi:outer membrane murein-binding lipoprotein Lpp
MNESLLLQLVVQAGALGICALMVLISGRKMDRLSEAIYTLVQRVELSLDRSYRAEEDR